MSTLAILITCLAFLHFIFLKKERRYLPPSPRGLPLIGHLHLIPPIRPWIWFDRLGKQFDSPLIYLNLVGQDIIIVNDYQASVEILEKRSAKYSSRPRLVVASEYAEAVSPSIAMYTDQTTFISSSYASSNKRLLLLPYSEKWRQQRAALHRDTTPQKSLTYVPIQTAETKLLMRKILRMPSNFKDHFRQCSANVALKICYGLDSEGGNQQAIADIYELMERTFVSGKPGANLVDLFPSLDRLPDILAPWRPAALDLRSFSHRVFNGLLNDVLHKITRGELAYEDAFAARLWADRERFSMDELDVAYISGAMFEAGTDTTSAALSTFVLAAVTYPDAFNTAQAEVDRVCGEHSPTIDDFERCEYVRAMCKETLRWRPVTAGGVPHMATTTEDDWYDGMRIPAGATIIPNHWGMSFSTQTYGQKYDPQLFEPRRWIERPEGVGDIGEGHPAFGFGRRICPGRHIATQSLFLVIANLCYSFDIQRKDHVEVDTLAYTAGLNIEPEPFECNITPRPGRASDIEWQAGVAQDTLRRL